MEVSPTYITVVVVAVTMQLGLLSFCFGWWLAGKIRK